MLHLILGGPGSGKSTALTQAIEADVKAGIPTWLIIPEQQANLSERTMLPKLPTSAGLTFTITGFSRLAAAVSDRYGSRSVLPMPAGLCSLLMWSTLRDNQAFLVEYGSSMQSKTADSKLTSLLLATIDELRAESLTPQMLLDIATRLPEDDRLRAKLLDLALLYEAYNTRLEEFQNGQGDELAHLADLLSAHDYFAGGHVYIDSFTDFTAEEFTVLRHILRQADRVTMTLCCAKTSVGNPALRGVEHTLSRLLHVCRKEGIEVRCESLGGNLRAQSEDLRALGADLWDFSIKQEDRKNAVKPDGGSAITLLNTTNIYTESEAVALHILDLVHHGTRYGDIAVIFRDADVYRGVLDAALERHGIPYYFSEKTPLTDKPLARLLLSALRAVAHHWQAQDIMTILKTGLCPLSLDEIDLFEQYVSTWNINGAAFAQPEWTRSPDGYTDRTGGRGRTILEAANHVRETIMTPLLRLHAAISKGGKLPELCAALYRFMQELSLAERCAALAEHELELSYIKQAGETVRVFDTVCTTLTQISAYLPSLTLSTEELFGVLRMIFDQTEIASIPSMHDSVTVGSADTLRVENVHAAFVLGLCEGEFPAAAKPTGLLSFEEKEQLRALFGEGEGPRPMEDMQSANELFYVLRAMTKPSHHLFASTVRADTQGKQKFPSIAYYRLLLLYPYLKREVRQFDFSFIVESDIYKQELIVTEDDEDGEGGAEGESGAAALTSYTPVPAGPYDPSPEVMARYLRDELVLSQTAIEHFVQCPYSYYFRDLLRLREKKPARINLNDSGSFIHHVFEHVIRRCLAEDGTLKIPTEDELDEISRDVVNAYLIKLGITTLSELRTLHIFRRLYALAMLLLRNILEEIAHSPFRPISMEHHIGGENAATPYYELVLKDGQRILLGGTVDRVDCYKHEAEDGECTTYIRVVDYKTGSKQFKLSDVKSGLNMQMLIYLFSLCRNNDNRAAGVVYVAADNANVSPTPTRSGLLLNEPAVTDAVTVAKQDKIIPVSADDLVDLEDTVIDIIRSVGEDIFAGRAKRTPSKDACRYCPMNANCPEATRTSFK